MSMSLRKWRRALSLICAAVVAIPLGVVLGSAPAFAARRAVQGIQFGWPVDLGNCSRTPAAQQLLDDQAVLNQTSWIRIDFRGAGATNPPCDVSAGIRSIMTDLSARASWIKVIGLFSHEFVSDAGMGVDAQVFADRATAVACNANFSSVYAWEVWNEPSRVGTYLAPDRFADILTRTSWGLHNTCGRRVISGGVNAEGEFAPHPVTYLNQVSDAIAANPNDHYASFRAAVDGVGVHPYIAAVDPASTYDGHAFVRDFVGALYDAFSKPLYVTEFGWQYAEVGDAAQCDNLVHALYELSAQGYKVAASTYFTWHDFNSETYGIYSLEGVRRSVYHAYVDDDCGGATDGAYDPATQTLSWQDANASTSYEVALAGPGAATYGFTKTVTAKQALVSTFLPAVPDGTYTWRVTAVRNGVKYPSKKWTFTYVAPPVGPTGLTATVLGSSSIRLNWADNSGTETGYQISDSLMTQSAGANATSFTWSGLTAGTYKCFRVRAVNASGGSPWTPWACATTTPILAAPTNPTALALDPTSVKVSWVDTTSSETGFEITDNLTTRTVGPNITAMTWTGLQPGTYKCFRVRAADAGGFSAWTGWACVTTPATPAAPTGPTALALDTGSIKVSWVDNANNESGFEVLSGGVVRSVAANTPAYTWTGLAAGTSYCFQIRAVNTWGASAWSPQACAATPSNVPAAPSNVVVTALDGSSVKVAWSDNSGNETGFEVSNGATGQSFGANTTAMIWGGLGAGQYACFSVRAFNASGYSAWAPQACTSTLSTPAAPGGPSAVATGYNTIKVSWSDNSGNETGFTISNGSTTASVGANTTAFVWSGLAPGQTMCFAVQAVNNVGGSGWTGSACATTPTLPPPPAAPSGVFVQTFPDHFKVGWSDNSNNEDKFEISDGGVVGANQTSYVRSGVTKGVTMCFAVRAVNAYGESGWTGKVCATIP